MNKTIIIILCALAANITALAQTLSLDSCKAYSLRNNKKLIEAQLELKASKEVKMQAFTNYFPVLNANATAIKMSQHLIEMETPEMNLPVYDGNPANLVAPTQFAYVPGMEIKMIDYLNMASVTAIQPIYMGGQIRNGNKLAQIGAEVGQQKVSLRSDEVIAITENYYWNIVSLKEKKQTLFRYEKLMQSLLKDVRISQEAGLIDKSDVLKVELELSRIDKQKLQINNGIELLSMTLAQHMGVPYSREMDIAETEINLSEPVGLFSSPETALANRFEYQMLSKAVDVNKLQKKMERGKLLPSLAAGLQGLYLDYEDTDNTYAIGFATLTIPISDWWGGSHKLKEKQIRIDIAQNQLSENSELMMLQMEKYYKDLLEAWAQIKVANHASEQAKEHLKIVNDNYNAGIASTSDLLEAQAMNQQSLDGIVDAKTSYKIKQALYLQSIGELE